MMDLAFTFCVLASPFVFRFVQVRVKPDTTYDARNRSG